MNGIGDWVRALDQARIPIFYKSVDNAGPLFEAQELMKVSAVPHTLVYRVTTHGQDNGIEYDVPNYALEPAVAAAEHWQKHLEKFPPELDPEYIWLETINEVDRNRSAWLGEFALETAKLALRDGYRWAAFGWSSGEPEPADWESPAMLDFLELAGQYPDQLAVALHEYSYLESDIGNGYPYLIGRFQELFRICDKHGIPRPTVLITEWGWTYNDLPDVDPAMEDISWAAWMYSAFPQIRGAAIWYLGPGFDIADEAQKLISPVTDYSLSNYFATTPIDGEINPDVFAPMNTSTSGTDWSELGPQEIRSLIEQYRQDSINKRPR
jgi:hypothetical protein